MLIAALALHVFVATPAPMATSTSSATYASTTTSLRAGLVVAGAGASLVWMRRVSTDARTQGLESEATRMLDAPRPIGGVGALAALSWRAISGE